MSVTVTNSTQYALTASTPKRMNATRDAFAPIKFLQFDCVQGAVAGDATSQFILGVVPWHAKILPVMGSIYVSGFDTTDTVKLGYQAFDTISSNQRVTVAQSLNAFIDTTTISADMKIGLGVATTFVTPFEIPSICNDGPFGGTGLVLVATFGGTATQVSCLPAAAHLTGMIAFVEND